MNIGLILAAGKGERMGGSQSKQYLLLKGRPVLVYCLETFSLCEDIDELVVVVSQEDIEFCKKEVVDKYRLTKVKKVIAGGEIRQDSVANGLKILPSGTEIVVIHDGARPLVTSQVIKKAILALSDWDGVVVGVPVIDTIKLVDEKEQIKKTIERGSLWQAQTPQVFKIDILAEAHKVIEAEGYYGTDDASLVERLGLKVRMVKGSYDNIKITVPKDLVLAEAILDNRSKESG